MSINWDIEYPLGNSGYEQPETQVAFMQVPWDNSYSDIVDFDSLSAQTTAMNSLIKKTINYMNYFKKDNAFDVAGNVAEYEQYNYLRFVNQNYNNKYFYCFIDRIEYRTKDCTRIYVSTDVWQTWQFNIRYFQSFIERSHVAKADDTIGANIQSEPMGGDPEFQTQIDIFKSLDWSITWCMEALSAPPDITQDGFQYGGVGEDNNDFYGYYMNRMPKTNTGTAMRGAVKMYETQVGETQDHRNDIISVRALPSWAAEAVPLDSLNAYMLNRVVSADDDITVNLSVLNNGYTPRNKKLLTSLYTFFTLYNFNGLNIPLKPELITENKISVHLSMKPCTSTSIRLAITTYNDYLNTHYKIPYNASTGVAYNENTGVQKALNVMNGASGLLGSTLGLAGSIASKNPLGAIGSVANLVTSGIQTVASVTNEITANVGSCSDIVDVLETNIKLRLIQSCPTLSECQRIDKFFDVFGYSQNVYGNIKNWFTNRSNWNFIKTTACKIQLNGNQDDLAKIKNIFDTGVTVWHGVDNYGDYTQDNN